MRHDKNEAYIRNIYRKIVNLPRPSFSQFVSYLLRTKVENYNDHWLPYWIHCHFCQQGYRVVGRFENILEDTKYIEGRSDLFVFCIIMSFQRSPDWQKRIFSFPVPIGRTQLVMSVCSILRILTARRFSSFTKFIELILKCLAMKLGSILVMTIYNNKLIDLFVV